jgi:hypothetical protein
MSDFQTFKPLFNSIGEQTRLRDMVVAFPTRGNIPTPTPRRTTTDRVSEYWP